ncbi:GNAT family N-acetyltransferase [Marinomonas ostreistagni]|uniref:GNAT family N-acetyltransferase n=1 Tax=Marinomonas ostreistagni TaxID=359209 RepID=UPI00194EA1DD|nr:GNAT family N-acetyltransferase [Marinomonas ostreistagni]MBM6550062.1 GNAT family N-acetyltransferase [Marinomonas ostreistagni]
MVKIELELIKEHHLEAICALANNPNISRTSGVPDNCQPEHVQAWIQTTHAPQGEEMHFVIWYNSDIVGCCILKKICYQARTAELSYWIGEPYWGKGIASQAATFALRIAFEVLHLEQVDAHFLKHNNQVSAAILYKLGFKPDPNREDLPVSGRFNIFEGDLWSFVSLPRAGATA